MIHVQVIPRLTAAFRKERNWDLWCPSFTLMECKRIFHVLKFAIRIQNNSDRNELACSLGAESITIGWPKHHYTFIVKCNWYSLNGAEILGLSLSAGDQISTFIYNTHMYLVQHVEEIFIVDFAGQSAQPRCWSCLELLRFSSFKFIFVNVFKFQYD